MFKLSVVVLCMAIIGSAMCAGDLKKEIVDGRAEEIAKWAGSKLGDYAGVQGDLLLQGLSKVSNSQDNEKFKFDLEVNYAVAGSKVAVKRCRLSVTDIPTENVRLFNNAPSCFDL